MSSEIGISARPEVNVDVSAQVRQAVEARAEVVMEVDVSATAEIMGELLLRGEIVMPGMPEEDDPGKPDEGLADALTSDIDWSDEDDVPPTDEVPIPRHVYALRVSRTEGGGVRCNPPYSDWSGAMGKTRLGICVLKNHNNRLRAYRALAEFLTEKYAEQLAQGPQALALGLVQKEFAKQSLKEVGEDQLSRFLHNCDLVWDDDVLPGDVAMPIRTLFQER